MRSLTVRSDVVMNSGLTATALVTVLAVLLVLPATTLAAIPPATGATRDRLSPEAARPLHSAAPAPSPAVPWSPASGRSSPGSPHYTLSSASLVTSGCNTTYAGESWMAFDAYDQSFWVAAAPDCVEVFPANASYGSPSASYVVGSDPFGVAVDSTTHEIYVANSGSNNVTVLNDSSGAVVASIGVGSSPSGVAFDPATGAIFVANNGSDNVSVINGSLHRVVASLSVGVDPIGIAVDPATRQAFVANSGSANLTVISTRTVAVTGSIGTGSGPFGVAIDNRSDRVYVTDRGSNNLTVVNATADTVMASVPVVSPAMNLQGVAYDPKEDLVWVGGGYSYAVVVNASTNVVGWYLTVDPSGVAVDPSTGEACLSDTSNRSFLCISNLTSFGGWNAAELDFTEQGLPSGAAWSVTIPPATLSAATTTLRFGVLTWYSSGTTYAFTVATVYGLQPSPATGNITVYPNSTVTLTQITFGPPTTTYLLNFTETGLPIGTTWGVSVDGPVGYTNGTTVAFAVFNGTHNFSVVTVPGYSSTPTRGLVTIQGHDVTVNVTFVPAPPPAPYTLSFAESGLPVGTVWSVSVNGTPYATNGAVLSLRLPGGTYLYSVVAPPGYSANPTNGTVFLDADRTLGIQFTPTYTLTFNETGLPAGTTWTVRLDGAAVSSLRSAIVFVVVAGNHSFTVSSADPAFAPSPSSGTIAVAADTVVPVTFPYLFPPVTEYAVTFQESGLPSGAGWTVTVNGTAQSSNTTTIVVQLRNGSYPFQVLPTFGLLPAPTAGSFAVAGGPVGLTIQFTSTICGGCPSVAPPTGFAPYSGALVLAAAGSLLVGVALGLVLGYVLAGRRRTVP